jgi:hypothetical protein
MVVLLNLTLVFSIIPMTISEMDVKQALSRLALVCMGLEQTTLYIAMMYQYSRVIAFCKASEPGQEEGAGESNVHTRHLLRKAIRKMRFQQLVMLVTGLATWGVIAYYAITLQFYWFCICITLAIDCFIYFTMALSNISCYRITGGNKKMKLHGHVSGGGEASNKDSGVVTPASFSSNSKEPKAEN